MAKRRTREQWAALVSGFERSKQSVEQFCAARELAPATLRWWRWKLRETAPSLARHDTPVSLLAVDIVGEVATPARIAIAVSGAEVRFEVGTDVDYVASVVASLRARC